MRSALVFCLLLLCQSISYAQGTNPFGPNDSVPDDIVTIELLENYSVRWNNARSKIVHDRYFSSAQQSFNRHQAQLIALINDSTETAATACGVEGKLTKGQLAFLLIDEVKSLPAFAVLHIQFDVFEAYCPYSVGLLEFIGNNRNEVAKKVAAYLNR